MDISLVIITYNEEKYIKGLKQKTRNYPNISIVVANEYQTLKIKRLSENRNALEQYIKSHKMTTIISLNRFLKPLSRFTETDHGGMFVMREDNS